MSRSLLFLLLLSHIKFSISLDIYCEYEKEDWGYMTIGSIYECEVASSLSVTQKDTQIGYVGGYHSWGFGISNVQGFHVQGKTMHYLPKGIAKFFANLIGLSVSGCELKEITQDDLKVFTKLKHAFLIKNEIEVIEADLFKFNPSLIYVNLNDNQIKEVHPTAFNGLTSLKALLMNNNKCIDSNADDNDLINKLIETMKDSCWVAEITTMSGKASKITEEPLERDFVALSTKIGIALGVFVMILIIGVGVMIYMKKK
ncbi:hypothetical protein ACKWTF_015141 [Chironomus riparius]